MVTAVAIEVVHPGIRSTGASVLSLFQNLLGLAAGPFIAGWVSDAWSLETALTAFGLLRDRAFSVPVPPPAVDMSGDSRLSAAALPPRPCGVLRRSGLHRPGHGSIH